MTGRPLDLLNSQYRGPGRGSQVGRAGMVRGGDPGITIAYLVVKSTIDSEGMA